MPEMSSKYLLVKLKGEEETKVIPVIVITGQREDGYEDLSLKREMLGRRGAVAYLTKPVDFNALLDVLKRHIRMPRGNRMNGLSLPITKTTIMPNDDSHQYHYRHRRASFVDRANAAMSLAIHPG